MTTATEEWNPRYEAYAEAHGNTPEEQLAADRLEFPGGLMAGFIVWRYDGVRVRD